MVSKNYSGVFLHGKMIRENGSSTLSGVEVNITKKARGADNKKPIESWWKLVNSNCSTKEMNEAFKKMYCENLPTLGEIIMTGVCPYNCLHCLYPQGYELENPSLSLQNWKTVINNLYYGLGIRTFIHCGRILDDNGIEILAYLRNNFDDIQMGIINDGISLLPYINHLSDIRPNWIDISVDGLEKEHDLQRNASGRFQQTLKSLLRLKESDITSKINLLTTVTSINISIITEVIKFFNDKGFKNFFISPVIDFKPWKSNDSIKINDQEWVNLFNNICKHLGKYNDTWIELACYEIDQIVPFIKSGIIRWDNFNFSNESMCWAFSEGNNNLYINFEPLSLVGIKECVITPGGKIIFNKSMATGRIQNSYLLGDAVNNSLRSLYQNLHTRQVFNNYRSEFLKKYPC